MPFLSLWDILGIFAYTQAFALLESSAVLFGLLLVGAVLPARFFRDRFLTQASTVVFAITFWIIVFQSIISTVRRWTVLMMLFWFGLALVSVVLSCILVRRSKWIERVISAFVERLTVFLYIYVFLGLVGLLVVIVRNLL